MSKKVTAKKALKFFEDNLIMLASCETKEETGCTEKCLQMLRAYVKEKSQSNSVDCR